ncbi:MAG: DUF1841 family protein [Gammaproteobacteria bacterium]|nr:DUF1841 family protein [Gammaproteobacteria bacterium]MDH5693300.1 DUF1841 family protein [Gammaproteobacteria bacterium]
MFGQDRNQIRQFFFDTWQKVLKEEELTPLESQIASVIKLHPEYHHYLANLDNLDKDFSPELGEANPFLHMGLHIAIEEQLSTRRPDGILEIFNKFKSVYPDPHDVSHQMMECLGDVMWRAQQDKRMPDDKEYLDILKQRLSKAGKS